MGVLLSGGLDSSLTSAIVARKLKSEGRVLHSFSIGLSASAPDLIAARKVAQLIGTRHHEVHFTVQEGIDAIDNLIWHMESYDVTTIRASVPMYLLSKYIHQQKIKVILSGEGSDEAFGGYLNFNNAPNDREFQKETINRVLRLPLSDCLRADKATMAFSLETRVPFLDKHFLQHVMNLHPKYKRHDFCAEKRIEKYIIRRAFDPKECGITYLPDEVLWRQKEQFSDGVGYGWIEGLKQFYAQQVSDDDLKAAQKVYPINTPETKEAVYIRNKFHQYFPNPLCDATVVPWEPKWSLSKDPSARFIQQHNSFAALNNQHIQP